jgi:hypothetical protein
MVERDRLQLAPVSAQSLQPTVERGTVGGI